MTNGKWTARLALVCCAAMALGGFGCMGSKKSSDSQNQTGMSSMISKMSADASTGGSGRNGSRGDECGLLSKADVSAAIGIPIADAKADEHGCHYYAHGTVNSLAAKHTAASLKGSNPQMIKAMLGDQPDAAADLASPVLTSVLDVEVWHHGGLSQFNIENTGIAFRKPTDPPTKGLEGIGDNAFRIGNNAIIAHKGDTFINITYTNCPCTTEQIVPLAKKVSDAL